ncbi:MAG TPA: dienelactone hydrolase family protein [Anaerolineae bacterium]|nr:dienelactone hydrolase family protein [Anaerolineae bacterium]
MSLAGFEETEFEFEGKRKVVYRRGSGPAVVVMHEMPGITPAVAAFGRRVADEGFTVFMPVLFGTVGKPPSLGYALNQIARACISWEFTALTRGQSSPVTVWLRALCRYAHEECGGPGVGALGMCFTGNFALSLMVDETVMAPVLSQPSLPFPLSAAHKRDLAVSDEELAVIKERVGQGCKVLGLAFSEDGMVPAERFERLRQELGEGFEGIIIDSSPGNPYGIARTAHSVVTNDLVDEEGHPTQAALHRVLSFFRERLQVD